MKSERGKLIERLDKLVSKIVRERDGRCVTCESTERLTCGHLFSRQNYSTRWDLNNCFAQCISCNLKHEYSPKIFIRWYINRFGIESYEELATKHHRVRKWKDFELEELLSLLPSPSSS